MKSKVQPLMIGHPAFDRLITHAEENKIDIHALMRILKGQDKPMGDRHGFWADVPYGYRICFNIEQQPGGWARHVSVSLPRVAKEGRYPGTEAMKMIIHRLGYKTPMEQCTVYLEEPPIGAVNVIEFIDKPTPTPNEN
jgi:hypothetical protein